jgi:hypothetical protein
MIYRSYAQDYLNIYKEYLPNEVRKSNELSLMVTENLSRYAGINPELVYFYISDLQLWFDAKDTISARLLDQYLVMVKNYYILQRSNWAINQLGKIKKSQKEYDLIRKGESYLENLFKSNLSQNRISAPPFSVDSEKLDNIVLLYYKQACCQHFDFSNNGNIVRTEVEQNIANKFNLLAKKICREKDTELYPLSIVNEYKTFWYLFPIDSTFESDSSSFLSNYITYRYSRINSSLPLSFSLMKVYNYFGEFNYNISVLPAEYSYNVLATSVINEPQFMIQGSYSFDLKPVKVPFSQLTFSLSYLWSAFTSQNTTVDLQAQTNKPIATFNQRELTIRSLQSIFFSVTTPLIYVNRNIMFEGGGLIGLNKLYYSFNYGYNSQPDTLTNINYAFSVNDKIQWQFIYMPIIKMRVDLPYALSLSAYYSFWLYSFGIEYKI